MDLETDESLEEIFHDLSQLKELTDYNGLVATHCEKKSIVEGETARLKQENENLLLVNQTWVRTDSLKTVQLNYQNQMMIQQKDAIQQLERSLQTSRTVGGTAIGVGIVATVLCLLLK